jgi:hypothetical protein
VYKVDAYFNIFMTSAPNSLSSLAATLWLRKNSINMSGTTCRDIMPYIDGSSGGKVTLSTVVNLNAGDKVNLYFSSPAAFLTDTLEGNEVPGPSNTGYPVGNTAAMTITKLA